jgi:hypothetical protein
MTNVISAVAAGDTPKMGGFRPDGAVYRRP